MPDEAPDQPATSPIDPTQTPVVRFAPTEDPIAGAVSRLDRGLLWPKLLGAPRLAMVPGSVGLALFATVLLALVDSVSMALLPAPDDGSAARGLLAEGLDAVTDAFLLLVEGLVQGQLRDLNAAAFELTDFAHFLAAHPLNALMCAVPAAFIAGIFGTAISRTAAVDVSIRQRIGWTDALGFGLGTARASGPALLGVPVVAGLAALLLAIAGAVLMTWPGGNLVGAVFYGLMLLLGGIASLALIGFLPAGPLMVPAVACDDADGFDAVQRAYAYLIAAPLRLIGYLAVATAAGVLLIALLSVLAQATIGLTSAAVWAFADPSGEQLAEIRAGEASGTWAFVAYAVSLWEGLVGLLVASVAVSYFFSASTLVYLLIRQAVDGQHHTEIYAPQPAGPRVREPVELDDEE